MKVSYTMKRITGRLLLLLTAACSLLACQGTSLAFGSGQTVIPYNEDFEAYTNNSRLVVDTNGWYSEAEDAVQVKADTSITNWPGHPDQYPLTNSTRLNLCKLDSPVTNQFAFYDTQIDPVSSNRLWIDMMLQPKYWEETNAPAMSNAQLAVYINSNGHIVAWCSSGAFEPAHWVEMDHAPIQTGDWVRLTIELYYLNPNMLQYSFFKMKLNNSDPITNYVGMTSVETWPDDLDTRYGPWFLMDYDYQNAVYAAEGSCPSNLNSIAFSGSGYVDDLVVTNRLPKGALTFGISMLPDAGATILGPPFVTEGKDQTYTISANIGYDGTNVIIDSVPLGYWTNSYTFYNVLAPHEIRALTQYEKRWLQIYSSTNGGTAGLVVSNQYDYNTLITSTIGGSPVSGVGTQLACVAFTRTISEPMSQTNDHDSLTSTVFTIVGNASNDVTVLTWNWQNQYWLDTARSGPGRVDILDQWCRTGLQMTVTASTNSNGGFADPLWTGNTNGAVTNNSSITVTMDQARRVVANFTGSMFTTNYHTSLAWIDDYFDPNTDPEVVELADSDGDGILNWQEHIAGTDPTDSNSVFVVLGQGALNSSNYVRFFGAHRTNNGVTLPFGMYRSTNLVGNAWGTSLDSIPRAGAVNGTNTWWDVSVHTNAVYFYRPVASNAW